MRVKRQIFVGSSVEGLEKARQICDLLATLDDVEPVLWTSVFEPGLLTFEALENMLLDCCGAVFVGTPDVKCNVRGRWVQAPSANIMLEFGLVAGRIGRHGIALCLFGGAELPSDLTGLTVVDMDDAGAPGGPGSPPPTMRPQDKLRRWTAALLPTADRVARTDIVHGYTGRWEFNLQLDLWRGIRITPADYAYVKGRIELVIPPNGQAGRGLAHGDLRFKLSQGTDPNHKTYLGEYKTAHELTGAYCTTDGSLHFTSEAFAVEKVNETGTSPPELSDLNLAEPWQAQWHLAPGPEPCTMEGDVSTDDAVRTHGTAKATKS